MTHDLAVTGLGYLGLLAAFTRFTADAYIHDKLPEQAQVFQQRFHISFLNGHTYLFSLDI